MTLTNTFNLKRLVLIFLSVFAFVMSGRDLHANEDFESLYNELYERASSTSSLEQLPPPDSIVKLTNGTKYAVVIWDTKTINKKASFNAILSVSIPNDDQKLVFFAKDVSFSNKVGIAGKVRLQLVNDVTVMKGEVVSLTFKAKDTYAEIDCKGFDKMNIGVDLEFSKKHILKENADGTISDDGLKTSLSLQIKDFSEFLANVNLPTFQIRGIKDLSITASQVYLDFSDYANPPNLPLDVKYDSIFRMDSTAKLWQGVYLGQVSIRLPKFLKKGPSNERIEIGANKMVIDEFGFTGTVYAGNLVGLSNGNLGKWAFSLDQLGVVLKKSVLEQGYFKGRINIPIGKEKDTVGYKCSIGMNGSYEFKVNSFSTMSFPILKADTVNILPNSSLTIKVMGDTVNIRACLNGSMSISAPINDTENDARFQVGNVGFEGLEVANHAPALAIKAIAFTSADKGKSPQLYKFPVTISSLRMTSEGKSLQLGIELMLNLNEKFGAGGGITLHGKIYEKDGKIKYDFDRTVLNSFKIDATFPKFRLKGEINAFEKDREFGTGFKGNVDMEVKLSDKTFNVAVGAIFGRIRDNRYWYADGRLTGIKIPIFENVYITGFAGGAYNRMRRDFKTRHPLAQTLTGQRYLPDSTAGMGFQAGVTLGIPDAKTMEGRLILELAFNKNNGLRRIFLIGEAECMVEQVQKVSESSLLREVTEELAQEGLERASKDLEKDIPLLKHFSAKDSYGDRFSPKPAPKDVLKASMVIDMNFEDGALSANFKPYISLNGGMLRGAHANGLAGEGDLYFGKDKWHVCMGKPSQRLELLVANMASFNTYFMLGNDIEGSPPPPVEISQILNMNSNKLDYMRDMNAMKDGRGIAFGAGFSVDSPEKQFSIFYYRLSGGGGFDLMLKDYGKDAYCVGRSGTVGVNGWVANGQAYAYFQGSVGLKVRLAFITGRYEILSVGAAALLQAKLPNPTWMRGIVGGRYNILNGLVKGNCRIEVELGEQCTARNNTGELDAVKVIAQLTPDSNKTDVSVFVKPQAVFNMPIDEVFSIEDPQYPGTFKKYRAVVKTLDIRSKTQDKVVGEMQWNEDHTTVAFKSSEILAPQKDFVFNVEVGFKQEINGAWQAYKDEKGQELTEKKSVSFRTGDAPDHIPVENLQFTYPVISQKNFHKGMSTKGYIQLIQGQDYLFKDAKYSPSIVVTDNKGTKVEIPVKYDVAKKNVVYNLPRLQTDRIYTLSFENMPQDRDKSIDKNVTTQSKEVLTDNNDTGSSATINTKSALGVIEKIQGKVLLSYPFRTSMYNTLQEKIASNKVEANYFNDVNGMAYSFAARIVQPNEAYDASELNSDQNLISFEVNFKNHAWFTDKLRGYVYQDYPVLGSLRVDRDTALLGFVPTRDVTLTQTLPIENLTGDEVNIGTLKASSCTYTVTGYFHHTMYRDYQHIKTQVANLYSKGTTVGKYVNMLTDTYAGINRTQKFVYPVEVYYLFPWEKVKKKVGVINVVLD